MQTNKIEKDSQKKDAKIFIASSKGWKEKVIDNQYLSLINSFTIHKERTSLQMKRI